MAKEDIRIFADHCVFMWSVFLHGQTLYERSHADDHRRMRETAKIFFGDLHQVFVEYVILQVCKMTDPVETNKKSNLTVRFLVAHYGLSGDPKIGARLAELDAQLDDFRQKVLPARNKLISHADRESILAGKSLGAASDSDWNQFWTTLSELVSLIYERICGSPFSFIDIGMATDVEGLLKALTYASHFEDLLKDDNKIVARRAVDLAFSDRRNAC